MAPEVSPTILPLPRPLISPAYPLQEEVWPSAPPSVSLLPLSSQLQLVNIPVVALPWLCLAAAAVASPTSSRPVLSRPVPPSHWKGYPTEPLGFIFLLSRHLGVEECRYFSFNGRHLRSHSNIDLLGVENSKDVIYYYYYLFFIAVSIYYLLLLLLLFLSSIHSRS